MPGASSGIAIAHLPTPEYPFRSRRLGEEGAVVLEVEVLPDGCAGAIRVVEDPGYPRLVAAAIDAIRKSRFRPATRGGTAVRAVVQIPFRFVIH